MKVTKIDKKVIYVAFGKGLMRLPGSSSCEIRIIKTTQEYENGTQERWSRMKK